MTIVPGSRFGPYEIVALLGRGGMGEVYRAHDTKLGRDVAIKILPPVFTTDRERVARFEREARVLAALNHPQIGAIYGVEDAKDVRGLVLELVEGPTLAERLKAGPVPISDVVAIARQIIDALDAAHEKGIVHRDLKPSNIKITSSGAVKVLDFGLAKSEIGDPDDPSQSPTRASMTRGGDILGTAAYMSPEQARGLAVDKRSDIWAFGCVLFEMLTGRQAFCGDTVTDIIVSVLTREIDCTAIPRETPAGLRRLLNRCLHRDPWRRLRDVGDARAELDEATATTLAPPANVPVARTREVEFQRLTDLVGLKESPAISPDGKMAAFVAYVAGHRQIWVRLLAGGALLQVTHDSIDHAHPRWAPDSCTLIYYTPSERRDESGTIWEVSALGGWPRPVARALGGADISHDGQRIALFQISGQQQALMIVSRDGSRAERVGLLAVGYTYTSPRWAPDDSAVAFLRAYDRGFEMCLEVAPLTGTEHQVVARSEWLRGFSWLPDGSGFVYGSSRGSTLLYPPVFNLRTIGRRGNDDRQLSFGDQSFVDPDAHQSGKLLVSRFRSRSDIWRFPTQGSPAENTRDARRVTRQTGHVQVPTASPDGTEVAYVSDSGGHANLWIARTDGSSARQLTFDHDPTTSVGVARWSPTGGLIVFLMASAGGNALWAVEPNGSGLRRLVAPAWSPCWSSDGRWLYYQSFAEGGSRLEKVSLDGQHKVVVRDDPEATFPTISPDGRVLYFVVSLRSEIAGWLGGDVEIRCAEPEDGPSRPIARVTPARAPFLPLLAQIALSPDGTSFTIPMVDGATTNLWSISTKDGAMKPLTDFGDRSVLMTRSVSWSADGRFLYAALAEYETDIVLIDGLLP